MQKLLLLSVVCLAYKLALVNGEGEKNEEDGRVLSIFNVVTFPNSFCTGGSNRNGTCYTAEECTSRGGTGSGACASGYGVCCIISLSCGGTSSDNCTYIEQTSFTSASSLGSNPCTYTICRNSNMICRIRLDFTSFTIANPFTAVVSDTAAAAVVNQVGAIGDCTTDTFTFSSSGNQGSPVICGFNSGQHMILDASSSCNILTFNIGASSSVSRSWNIKATQYMCGDHDSLGGPPGCLQYYTGATGTLSSFNYPTTSTTVPTDSSHLSNQCYTICFRQEASKCSICYVPAIEKSFGLSVSPDPLAKSASDTQCSSDYLQIPFGVAPSVTSSTVNDAAHKFCGRIFKSLTGQTTEESICSFDIPFRVDFKTDADEVCAMVTNAMTCEASKSPGGTIGFSLKFSQRSC